MIALLIGVPLCKEHPVESIFIGYFHPERTPPPTTTPFPDPPPRPARSPSLGPIDDFQSARGWIDPANMSRPSPRCNPSIFSEGQAAKKRIAPRRRGRLLDLPKEFSQRRKAEDISRTPMSLQKLQHCCVRIRARQVLRIECLEEKNNALIVQHQCRFRQVALSKKKLEIRVTRRFGSFQSHVRGRLQH